MTKDCSVNSYDESYDEGYDENSAQRKTQIGAEVERARAAIAAVVSKDGLPRGSLLR